MQTESEVKMNPEVSEVNSEIEKIMQDESSEGSSSLAVLLALYDARETVWKQAFSIFSQRLRELVKKHHPEWDISQGGLLAEHWDWIRFSDTSTDKAACVRYTVEILIQSQSGRTGDLGGGRVVLQLPTELLIGVYDGDGETLIRRHRPIRQIADIRSRDGVEYMLSAYSVEEITNEIERESASAKEELSSLRRTP
jgi:hypothetical protein